MCARTRTIQGTHDQLHDPRFRGSSVGSVFHWSALLSSLFAVQAFQV